jgi:LmbE family N-acetylglucosaminyl deacetylase
MEERPVGNGRSCLIGFDLSKRTKDSVQLLCLGAHSDDIEIGCGGTLLHLKQALPGLKFYWVVFSACGPRGREAEKGAELFTAGCQKEIVLKDYRDGFLPYNGAQLKDSFEELKNLVHPDVIFVPWGGDAHQDHRLLSELTWNTFRNHLILEYEIPKYDGDMGRPNLFVPLDSPLYQTKIDFLFEAFRSQRSKQWFDRETFLGLMRIRGIESNSPSGYAEAFHVRKVALQIALRDA